jgi:hypothetical protein
MSRLGTESKRILESLGGVLLCAIAAAAQVAAPLGQPSSAGVTFTKVTPQYNYSYGAAANQPELPTDGVWNFYMPLQVTSTTPGWTTGEYGIKGVPDAFYVEPAYTSAGQYAGGCSWNQSYDAPPAWVYDGGQTTDNVYKELSGPILRAEAVIGSVYQSASQQVSGSGQPLNGFAAAAEWNPDFYTSAPYMIGAIYFATNSCYSGDTEYGFAHYNYYDPPVDQFYFSTYSNCSAPSGTAGSYACVLTDDGKHTGVGQCEAGVNLPTLQPNSKGNNWYFWYAYVSQNSSNGHYEFTAAVEDPYTKDAVWSCVGDPLGSPIFPVATCPQTESTNYTCPGGQENGEPFPTEQLYGALGSVTVGIVNASNTPPAGRANPMLRMSQLYIVLP